MEPITQSARTVVNIHTATYQRWTNEDGTELLDQGYLQLDDSFAPGSGFYIYKMEPGAVTTPHEHTCRENFLILEGELIDNDGYVYRPGDFVMLAEGSRHSSTAPDGCLIAVFVRTIERDLET
ncbi:MAG TPA: cupin domain-containing protein [Solirubrobacteraceae bacterium]|nr:cupin domain-containing protein [Solirubrobacteraceae bacterium]